MNGVTASRLWLSTIVFTFAIKLEDHTTLRSRLSASGIHELLAKSARTTESSRLIRMMYADEQHRLAVSLMLSMLKRA
jgi:hypothetical protein